MILIFVFLVYLSNQITGIEWTFHQALVLAILLLADAVMISRR